LPLLENTNRYYQEASYGQFSITGDVYGYLKLPINETCTQGTSDGSNPAFSAITTAGIQAAKNAGIDLSLYDSYVFMSPTATQCFGGYASLGGNPGLVLIRLNGFLLPVQTSDLAHELGHNLGLNHPHTYGCNAIYDPNANCPIIEYGDPYDVMGGIIGGDPPAHFNASFKELLGWLVPQQVSATGLYSITPIENAASAATNALTIQPLNSSESFTVEFRQPIGFDSVLYTAQVYKGALFHLSGNPSFILNMHPQEALTSPASIPTLLPGEKYTDYANRFSVTTISTSPASVQVRVLIPPINAPTLAFTNPTNGAVVGGAVTVAVDALDRSGISKVQFAKDGAPATTQNSAPYQFSWDATKETSGTHTLLATAYSASNASASATITVTVRKPPVVTVTNPTQFTLVPSITLSATVATDNAGSKRCSSSRTVERLDLAAPRTPAHTRTRGRVSLPARTSSRRKQRTPMV
jgi:hypothetical protein